MNDYFLWLAKFVTTIVFVIIIFGALIGISAGLNSIEPTVEISPVDKVAVIELNGPILDVKDIVKKMHQQITKDDIKGIVLRINSPGGAVAPSQEIYETVKRLKSIKPIVVSMGTVAASGGLYAALSASKIYVQPGTQTGSIGVIIQLPNFHKITSKYGFDFFTIKSGELKDVGNPTREFSETDRKFLQETVNKIYQQFFDAVVEGRSLDPQKVKKFADGRLILGSEAIELGLADEEGDLYQASRAVFDILGRPLANGKYPKLVYTENKLSKLKKLLESYLDLPLQLLNRGVYQHQKPEILLY